MTYRNMTVFGCKEHNKFICRQQWLSVSVFHLEKKFKGGRSGECAKHASKNLLRFMISNYLAHVAKMARFVVLAWWTTDQPSTDTGQPPNNHRRLILWNPSRLRRVLFIQFMSSSVPESSDSTTDDLQEVTSRLLTDSTLNVPFPNLATLASLHLVLQVTAATVERSFSDMRQVKTTLRSRIGENTLDQAMHVCIEGPPVVKVN